MKKKTFLKTMIWDFPKKIVNKKDIITVFTVWRNLAKFLWEFGILTLSIRQPRARPVNGLAQRVYRAQPTWWISTEFGMGNPLDPVGNLEILFWVDPPGGYDFGKTKKIRTFPHGPKRKNNYSNVKFMFVNFFGENLDPFQWAERS